MSKIKKNDSGNYQEYFDKDLSLRDVIKASPFHSLNVFPLYIVIALTAIDGTQYLIAFVNPGFHLGPIFVPE